MFSFKQVSIRTNAESIAFYRSEQFESNKCNDHLLTLIRTQLSMFLWKIPITCINNAILFRLIMFI